MKRRNLERLLNLLDRAAGRLLAILDRKRVAVVRKRKPQLKDELLPMGTSWGKPGDLIRDPVIRHLTGLKRYCDTGRPRKQPDIQKF